MMPAWYQRMNPRERVLSWIVAGTVAVLLNLWILSSLWGAVASAQKEFGTRRSKLAEQAVYVKERDTWTKRDEWMRQHQPTLKDPAEASALLDQVKEVAGKYNILVENPAIGTGESHSESSDGFRFDRNQKSVAAPGPFSLRRATAAGIRGFRKC